MEACLSPARKYFVSNCGGTYLIDANRTSAFQMSVYSRAHPAGPPACRNASSRSSCCFFNSAISFFLSSIALWCALISFRVNIGLGFTLSGRVPSQIFQPIFELSNFLLLFLDLRLLLDQTRGYPRKI